MSEQIRKEFEAWAKADGFNIARHSGAYDMPSTTYAWQVWQASRQSLVVKLPEVKFWLGDKSLECIDDFKKQLDAAGARYE